jgi:hypothetical protein
MLVPKSMYLYCKLLKIRPDVQNGWKFRSKVTTQVPNQPSLYAAILQNLMYKSLETRVYAYQYCCWHPYISGDDGVELGLG